MYSLLLKSKNSDEPVIIKHNVTIGRDKSNEIIIDSVFISRYHCKISYKNDEYILSDLHSKNGTFINGEKIKSSIVLHEGDTVSFGGYDTVYNILFQMGAKNNDVQGRGGIKRQIVSYIVTVSVFFMLAGFVVFAMRSVLFVEEPNRITNSEDVVTKSLNMNNPATLRDFIKQSLIELGEKDEYITPDIISGVEKYVEYYNGHSTYRTRMANREKYIGMIEAVLHEHNLQDEYSYVAFVESGFDNTAYNSTSGAAGMWQLMRSTAIYYGLKVNRHMDERFDVLMSTEAAASYISDMAAIFGYDSFPLVAASFNCGDGTLRAALKKIKNVKENRSFFYLCREKLIPYETRDYVFKVIGAIVLTKYVESKQNL